MPLIHGLDVGYPRSIGEAVRWLSVLLFAPLIVKITLSAIYNVYFHPLRNFPGPWLAKATPLPFVWRMINGRMTNWTTDLHNDYGHVVRLSPDELSFINSAAWADIYANNPQLPKPEKGTIISANGVRPIATITNTADHTRQRRILSHAFSDRALREQHHILHNYSDLLIKRLQDQIDGGVQIDISYWYNLIVFDIIADLCFGRPFQGLEKGEHHPWIMTGFRGLKIAVYLAATSYFPPLDRIIRHWIPQSLREKVQENFQFVRSRIDERISRKTERPDIMKFVLENNHEEGMSRPEIDSTIQVITFAGSETSATAMSASTYFLLRHPEAMDRLQWELRSAFKRADEITVPSVLKLPFLHAILQEAMRIHPPAAVALPRYTDRPVTIAGYHVPSGATVGYPQKTAYHHPSNFVNPLMFVPERWLPDADPMYDADDKAAFEPFLVGPRNCIGKSLAWAEMKLILAKVMWNFDVKLDKNNVENWTDQRVWLAHQRNPLNVRLQPSKTR